MTADARQQGDRPAVTHNTAAGQFELREGESVAVLQYELDGHRMAIFHTGVPPQLEGRGYGGQLARAALEHARTQGWRVVPHCSFVAAYIARHPEYSSLVDANPDAR